MRTLNRELGVSHNLLHQRYGSKQAIWYAAVDRGFGGLADQLGAHHDPRDQLRAFVGYSARRPDLLRIMQQEGGAPSERLTYLLDTCVRPIADALAPAYAALVATGHARAVPAEAFYYLVISGGGAKHALHGMTRQLFGADTWTRTAWTATPTRWPTCCSAGWYRRPRLTAGPAGGRGRLMAVGTPDPTSRNIVFVVRCQGVVEGKRER